MLFLYSSVSSACLCEQHSDDCSSPIFDPDLDQILEPDQESVANEQLLTEPHHLPTEVYKIWECDLILQKLYTAPPYTISGRGSSIWQVLQLSSMLTVITIHTQIICSVNTSSDYFDEDKLLPIKQSDNVSLNLSILTTTTHCLP